ncbi:MAG: cupin domain-containing protein [Gemmatimonadota bacterium]
MKVIDLEGSAHDAVTANPTRPATAVLHDTPAVRLVVFRIEPGQQVAMHTNPGTVLLTVISGNGTILGDNESHEVGVGSMVAYAPGELHGMQAASEQFCLLATIIHAH